MTTHSKNTSRLGVVIIGASLLLAGAAGAVHPTKDGKTCIDPRGTVKTGQPAPKPQQGNQVPDPDDSTKDWRDYINGNKKPPVRPKGEANSGQQQAPSKIRGATSDLQKAARLAAKRKLAAAQNGGTSGNQAPDPDDSTKKWRDYINGNKKPPVRPKP